MATFFTIPTETTDLETAKGNLKKQYHKLAIQYHPDKKGGSKETFQALKAEYEMLLKKLLNGSLTSEEMEAELKVDTEMREVLEKLIVLIGIEIEIVGSWLWITGDTFLNKDAIKAAKCRWSKNKQAWFWKPSTHKSRSRGGYQLEEIRTTFGSTKVDQSNFKSRRVLSK